MTELSGLVSADLGRQLCPFKDILEDFSETETSPKYLVYISQPNSLAF